MDEIQELYQQVILDHNKNPRNFKELDCANIHVEGDNPLCGDHIDLFLQIEDGVIKDVSFTGSGCAISKASASIMTTMLKGQKVEKACEIFEKFHTVVTSDPESEINMDELGKLAVFGGVREFPARIKCASLAWHTMNNAVNENKLDKAISE